ncbi:MAG TPA: DUF4135 domain-containing protein, partial [Thermoanaerobaculia bacterium]|nr:DUF4135 domain-containing protein [Thermoanaerobaculia bacterium]
MTDLADEQDFLSLLDPGALAVDFSTGPDWLGALRSISAETAAAASWTRSPSRPPELNSLAAPLVYRSWSALRAHAASLCLAMPHPVFDPGAIAIQLLRQLTHFIDVAVSRVLALELGIAKLEGRLAGETPGERYQSFLISLGTPEEISRFYRRYPVLARLIWEAQERWRAASCELLNRVCADWALLGEELASRSDPGILEAVEGGLGDSHNRGRSVQLLTFSSGLKVLYKPRSLAIDQRFAEILHWLKDRGSEEIRVPKTLDRGEYGWSEFVSPQPCKEPRELERFFLRQGALLAVLHALRAIDFHSENLIAAGEFPVPVDLELLFCGEFAEDSRGPYESPAEIELSESVMRVMLLPFLNVE